MDLKIQEIYFKIKGHHFLNVSRLIISSFSVFLIIKIHTWWFLFNSIIFISILMLINFKFVYFLLSYLLFYFY